MHQKVTMQDIADKLGITKVTVSKAINRRDGVSNALRDKILATAREMNYIKPIKESMGSHRFAFVCPKRYFLEDDSFYTTIFYYLNKYCLQKGSAIDCYVISTGDEKAARLPKALNNNSLDGIFIAGQFMPDFLAALLALTPAKVALDFHLSGMPVDCVISDNFRMGTLVTDELIANGHRHIGFVGDPAATSSICDRYYGYLKALALAGLTANEAWHIVTNDPLTGVYLHQVSLPDPLPSAFVCHCDKAAFLLARQLEQAGQSVPDKVSIISFDNTNLSTLMSPQLSSVDVNRSDIAQAGLQAVLERMRNPSRLAQVYYIQGRLITRASVRDLTRQE